ncbi:MAG: hypothetical protein LYZ69_09905 [Nitrososphaerales archaeon]|nr:hypothetical protein [Nitrososphaerales archaeon]
MASKVWTPWGLHETKRSKEKTILTEKLKVVNTGVSTFSDDLRSQDEEVVRGDWKPPAGGDIEMLRLLEKLGS